jgi:alcohol dehydrogenase
MFGRNITLAIGRSHVRTVMPAVLDLVAAGRIHPELVTTTVAPFADAAEVLREHLLAPRTKTVLAGPR